MTLAGEMETLSRLPRELLELWARLPGIGQLLLVLAGPILGHFSGVWRERSRAANDRRREHLKELREDVLLPLRSKIEEELLPVLRLEKCNVSCKRKESYVESGSVVERSWRFEDELTILDIGFGDLEKHPLYPCCKEFHYPEIIQACEQLTARIDTHNKKCLQYVQGLEGRLARETDLPLWPEGGDQRPEPRFVRPKTLASFIYRRQLHLEKGPIYYISFPDDPGRIVTPELPDGSGVFVRGTAQVADRIMKLVDELLDDKQRVDELKAESSKLLREAEGLAQSLDSLRYDAKLKGTCPRS